MLIASAHIKDQWKGTTETGTGLPIENTVFVVKGRTDGKREALFVFDDESLIIADIIVPV